MIPTKELIDLYQLTKAETTLTSRGVADKKLKDIIFAKKKEIEQKRKGKK